MNPANEINFVGQYWHAAETGDAVAWKAQSLIDPLMLADSQLARLYGVLSRRFAAGLSIRLEDLREELDEASVSEALISVSDTSFHHQTLLHHAERVFRAWQARRQLELLRLGVEEAERSLETPDRARRVAERLSMALLDTFANEPSGGRPQTRDELVDDQLDRMTRENPRGVVPPWPKMQEACGPWMPGEVIGLTGFSGSGKSTLTANLAMGLARRGVPVIVFPTEMGEQWVTRSACALSRFPQLLAEKEQYHQAAAEQRARHRIMLEEMRGWPWQVVNRANVTPAELVAAVRTLRREWAGEHVVVFVDHMHRLDYGTEEADKEAGAATRMLKNFAKEDAAGLTFVCLYQPKKPETDAALYQPIYANRIRGHSSIWNEVDVHLSIYRTWGERGTFGRTEWGDDAVQLNPDGSPRIARPFSESAVLNTEHTFMKPDKRRVGGEGPPFYLNIHKPSGQIYENATHRNLSLA
jgi:replicative DNA helicase